MQTTSEDDNSPDKPHMHYDISMSKRTRKPLNVKMREGNQVTPEKESPPESVKGSTDDQNENQGEGDSSGDQRKSLKLKQLIKGRRNSLGQHFTEEEKLQHLQVVVKQQEEELDGVKFKKMVKRCAKLLTHLISIKRPDPRLGSRKKPILRLGM